ncbi:MAG: enoyl-CoA hydratase/isomerase family protein, partial [Longimicrobiales bacterium]
MPRIRVEREGPVGRITLAHSERRNAIDKEMALELFDACSALEQEGQVRVVHLTADGEDFSVGADVQALSGAIGGS